MKKLLVLGGIAGGIAAYAKFSSFMNDPDVPADTKTPVLLGLIFGVPALGLVIVAIVCVVRSFMPSVRAASLRAAEEAERAAREEAHRQAAAQAAFDAWWASLTPEWQQTYILQQELRATQEAVVWAAGAAAGAAAAAARAPVVVHESGGSSSSGDWRRAQAELNWTNYWNSNRHP